MKIEEYISELLFEHDCVIVPGFGGFVCNYAPARIDPVKHLFEPPGKKILFNKGLTRNDGLLAHHISDKLKLSYSAALDFIAKEVKDFKEIIEKDKRLTFDNIGLLYIDDKGSMLFQQDTKLNYLAESFGLSAFYHLTADQEKADNEAKVIPLYNARKKARTYVAAATVAALITSAFCFTLLEKQTNIRFSSFDFLSKKEAPQYLFSASTYKELPKPVFEELNIVAVEPKPVSAPATIKPSSINNTVPIANAPGFSIIVGSFLMKENADNLISEYSRKNIRLAIVGRNPQGLYLVGYGNFQSHTVALSEIDQCRIKISKDSWIKAI